MKKIANIGRCLQNQGERILMRPPWLYCQRHILLLRPTSDACFKDFYPLFEEAKYGLDDPAYNHKDNLEETNNDKAFKNDYNETY